MPKLAIIVVLLQEIVLGIASLSALGPLGAAVEITVILHPCFTWFYISTLQPRYYTLH